MPSNFTFLQEEFSILCNIGVSAEAYLHADPVYCLAKLRLFGEKLTELLFDEHALEFPADNSFHNRLKTLEAENLLPWAIKDVLFRLRKKGNLAVHDGAGTPAEARQGLKEAFDVAKWFYETYSREGRNIHMLAFREPERADDQAARRKLEEDYKTLEIRLNTLLAERQTDGLTPERQRDIQERSERAARHVEMTEAETRALIDEQLRRAGWEADTAALNFKRHGTLPERGKARAVAEWPAGMGWADYALFVGTDLVGFVEAKRYAQDVSGDLRQAKLYAETVEAAHGATLTGPWGRYRVPFLFATNGRPYLEQIKTKSGIWFLDARRPTNLARPLQGWYSPEGLTSLRASDLDEANRKLTATPLDFLQSKTGLGLRNYQIRAIQAVEKQLVEAPHERRALLAMATGTGKTRTVIGLCYHLIQTNRFRRILFLIDRTLLGTQALNAFKDNKVVDLNTFADVYDVRELKHLDLKPDTRLHFATVQSMVKRLFYADPDDAPIPVDRYDCIVVDEAHRGYLLDKELDETDLTFKNQDDYVSKYRRVLEYFDAHAIGLTATPALHTTAIFGKPVFTYSYREAVIDGHLIDHDPPTLIRTQLGEQGITWEKGEKPRVYDPETNALVELAELEDELHFDIEGFNRQVLSESFNRTVVRELVQHLDPDGEEKTLVFAASDSHADALVSLLKEEFAALGVAVADNAIQKITGKSYNPQEQLNRYRNEKYPTIAVTVDLLTTGIDVPAICNLVFLRRVKSRILYEQMLGRATRRCDDIGKESFRIFDAVRIYETLENYTQMKPVVVNPQATFDQLARELPAIDAPDRARHHLEQLLAKLQRSKRKLTPEQEQAFAYAAGGDSPDALLRALRDQPLAESLDRVARLGTLWRWLDETRAPGQPVYVSEHADALLGVEVGYGSARRPEDYLENFTRFVRDNQNTITALRIVCTRPAELTRADLKELLLVLAQKGYQPRALTTAWRQARNQDIAADVVSLIRTLALGSALEPHAVRIRRAVDHVRGLQPWNRVQQKWLDRFEKQLLAETVLQVEDLDESPFADAGGFRVLDKVFDHQLTRLVQTINRELYPEAG